MSSISSPPTAQQIGAPMVRPTALPVLPHNIPTELKELKQWAIWRYVLKDGGWAKMPYKARASYSANASIKDPSTWSFFGAAITIYEVLGRGDGIMFALCDSDPYMGVDLDHVRDLSTGELEGWAQEIVARMPGYWEVSPSGTGLRHIRRGRLPDDGRRNGGRKKGDIEMYDYGRFLTITGHVLKGNHA